MWCQFVVWLLSLTDKFGSTCVVDVQIRGKLLMATAQATCVSAGELGYKDWSLEATD